MPTTYDSSGYDDALGRRDGGSSPAWRPLKLFFVMSWCGHVATTTCRGFRLTDSGSWCRCRARRGSREESLLRADEAVRDPAHRVEERPQEHDQTCCDFRHVGVAPPPVGRPLDGAHAQNLDSPEL